MDQRHGGHATLALCEDLLEMRVRDGTRLQAKHTGHHLQVVLHTVVDLFQQDLLFANTLKHSTLGGLFIGDVVRHAAYFQHGATGLNGADEHFKP